MRGATLGPQGPRQRVRTEHFSCTARGSWRAGYELNSVCHKIKMATSAKPVRHRDKWRIRWLDEHRNRQSLVFDTFEEAAFELKNGKWKSKKSNAALGNHMWPTNPSMNSVTTGLRIAPHKNGVRDMMKASSNAICGLSSVRYSFAKSAWPKSTNSGLVEIISTKRPSQIT